VLCKRREGARRVVLYDDINKHFELVPAVGAHVEAVQQHVVEPLLLGICARGGGEGEQGQDFEGHFSRIVAYMKDGGDGEEGVGVVEDPGGEVDGLGAEGVWVCLLRVFA